MHRRSHAGRAVILQGLLVAALVLTAAVALRLLSPRHVSAELASRLLGILLGLVVAGYANTVPKALAPLTQVRCDPAAEQAVRRVTGWSMALGGLAYAVTWAIAPLAYATPISAGLLGGAALLAVVRFALVSGRPRT